MIDSMNNSHQCMDTKSKIFAVAAHLFAEKGFNGVSMREISEKSDVTKPTIYYYFGSKEQIYSELVETGLNHVFGALEEIRERDIPVKERLALFLKRFFRIAYNSPEYTRFFLNLFVTTENEAVIKKFKHEADRRGRIIASLIKEGIDTGEFGASARPELAANIIGGVIQHFLFQQLATKEQLLTDELADEIIELLFKGLNE